LKTGKVNEPQEQELLFLAVSSTRRNVNNGLAKKILVWFRLAKKYLGLCSAL
jgi:hypothetical protein